MTNALQQIKDRNLKVCFKGEKHGWHLCSDESGKLYCISVDGNKSGNSGFGDRHHIKRLMSKGYFSRDLELITEHGLELMTGIYSQLMITSKGKKWSMLGFSQ